MDSFLYPYKILLRKVILFTPTPTAPIKGAGGQGRTFLNVLINKKPDLKKLWQAVYVTRLPYAVEWPANLQALRVCSTYENL
jgi:hypothetical protein